MYQFIPRLVFCLIAVVIGTSDAASAALPEASLPPSVTARLLPADVVPPVGQEWITDRSNTGITGYYYKQFAHHFNSRSTWKDVSLSFPVASNPTVISVTIEPTGRLKSMSVLRSSGSLDLDELASYTIRRIDIYPILPGSLDRQEARTLVFPASFLQAKGLARVVIPVNVIEWHRFGQSFVGALQGQLSLQKLPTSSRQDAVLEMEMENGRVITSKLATPTDEPRLNRVLLDAMERIAQYVTGPDYPPDRRTVRLPLSIVP